MPAFRPFVTKEWIERRIREGRGSGSGADYKPWLVIQDFSSLGRAHRMKGWKHGRVHHLFSDLERNVFLHYLYPRSVTDIREQFPLLPVEETVEIAREMGVRHPTDPRTKHPIVMTTDLLVSARQGLLGTYQPLTVKYFNDLQKTRTLEKLEIERRYWAAAGRNLGLKIVTEKQISSEFVSNMLWMHPFYWHGELHPLTKREVLKVACLATEYVLNDPFPLRTVAQRTDRALHLKAGTSLLVIRHLLATRRWEMDMNTRIRTDQRLVLLQAAAPALHGQWKVSA